MFVSIYTDIQEPWFYSTKLGTKDKDGNSKYVLCLGNAHDLILTEPELSKLYSEITKILIEFDVTEESTESL